uniref:Uncharacterized protein n=19 Tax=Nymphaea colorata TaxID=210225 RepID=A0A5K1BT47_9MAGN
MLLMKTNSEILRDDIQHEISPASNDRTAESPAGEDHIETTLEDNLKTKTEVHLEEKVDTSTHELNQPAHVDRDQSELPDDEGWQEAGSRGRLGNSGGRRFSQRKPALSKLNTNSPESSNFQGTMYKRKTPSPGQKLFVPPRTPTSDVNTVGKLVKSSNFVDKDNPTEHAKKLENTTESQQHSELRVIGKSSSPTSTVTTVASKFLSYKEVALATPGTVFRTVMGTSEDVATGSTSGQVRSDVKAGNKEENISSKAELQEEKVVDKCERLIESDCPELAQDVKNVTPTDTTLSPRDGKKNKTATEASNSKLSAAAEPFNPGALPSIQPFCTISSAGFDDGRSDQGVLPQPVNIRHQPSIAARVPCGPRLSAYYTNGHGYRLKAGYLNPVMDRISFSSPRTMNPDAAEFVPGKVWPPSPSVGAEAHSHEQPETAFDSKDKYEKPTNSLEDQLENEATMEETKKNNDKMQKCELARQILLSFIIKSVQDNLESVKLQVVAAQSAQNNRSSVQCLNPIGRDSAIIKVLYGNENNKELDFQSHPSCPEQSINAEENQCLDPIGRDSAIIKVLYGDENNPKMDFQSHPCQEQSINEEESKNRDVEGEGFTVVSKRRKNRQQFSSTVNDLYGHPSICTSAG